jgi:hypothetical protein
MWDPSPLTSSGQLEALRLLSEWLGSTRRGRPRWGLRRAVGDTEVARPDPLVRPGPASTAS